MMGVSVLRPRPRDDLARVLERGVTAAALERALRLSPGYLSKVKHGAVNPGEQLQLLLALLARHPTLLHEVGASPLPKLPTRMVKAPRRGVNGALALLAAIAPALSAERVRWALGGGVAMGAHGLPRVTRDVDVFIDDDDRHALRLLREAGAAVGAVSASFFLVYPQRARSHEESLDVVFVRHEPLRSALGRAQPLVLDMSARRQVTLPVLTALDLCVSKLASHGALDAQDAAALHDAGLVEVAAVRRALRALPRVAQRAGPVDRLFGDRALAEERVRGWRRS